MADLCKKCSLYAPAVLICSHCNIEMECEVTGISISWKCKKCGFNMATTIKRLCFVSNADADSTTYSKLNCCPYSKKRCSL